MADEMTPREWNARLPRNALVSRLLTAYDDQDTLRRSETVRAFLAAIREPTEGMVDAGLRAVPLSFEMDIHEHHIYEIWKAMILQVMETSK